MRLHFSLFFINISVKGFSTLLNLQSDNFFLNQESAFREVCVKETERSANAALSMTLACPLRWLGMEE